MPDDAPGVRVIAILLYEDGSVEIDPDETVSTTEIFGAAEVLKEYARQCMTETWEL